MNTRLTSVRRLFLALALAGLAGGLSGCRRPPSSVAGRVTYQGQPLTSGLVVLYCDGQEIVRGPIRPDGTCSIPEVPRGRAPVAVQVQPPLPEGFRKKYKTPPVVNGPAAANPGRAPAIPARYQVPEEPGLTLTVQRTNTVFGIDLTR